MPWLSLVPIAPERSSYNGILVLTFIALSGFLAAFAIHRLASRAVRRAPAWDCGFADAAPLLNIQPAASRSRSAGCSERSSSARPRRFEMPPPGSLAPARITVRLRDLVWEFGYAPIAACVNVAADWLNRVQFLTIRRYLGLVFTVLVVLLLGIAVRP